MSALHKPREPDQLTAAGAALAETTAQIAAINRRIIEIEAGASPAVQAVGTAQSLRSQKVGVIARLFRAGAPAGVSDVSDIDRELAVAERTERSAAAVIEAKSQVIAELNAEIVVLAARLPALQRDIAVAEFEALGAQIRRELVPAFEAAVAAVTTAYAQLAGAGSAHCEQAGELRERYGLSVQAIGTEFPVTTQQLVAIGFGFDQNRVAIGAFGEIQAAKAAALRRSMQ